MVKDLVVVGTGGWDVVPLIEDINADKKVFNFLGFLEKDKEKHGQELYGYPILGDDNLLLKECRHCCVVNNVMHTTREQKKVAQMLMDTYSITEFPSLIHPSVRTKYSTVGIGNIIYPGAVLGMGSYIGDFNIIERAIIGHETIIKNYNLLAACLVGSRCKVGSYNLIGNVKLGDDNEIGTGAVVITKIKSGHHLMGNPAVEMDDFIKHNF